MATRESPDVQAIRKLVEAASSFSKRGNHSDAARITFLAESIVDEGSLDLDGFEGLQDGARVSAVIAARLEAKTQ
jgi:hypothetical protein